MKIHENIFSVFQLINNLLGAENKKNMFMLNKKNVQSRNVVLLESIKLCFPFGNYEYLQNVNSQTNYYLVVSKV